MKYLLTVIIGISFFTSCNTNNKQADESNANSSMHHIEVLEVLQPGGYTYMFVEEGNNEYWIAVSHIEAKEGDDFYYAEGLEMKAFKSKELDRTFDSILFIDKLSTVPILPKTQTNTHTTISEPATSGKKENHEMNEIRVEPAEGGITIAELYKNRNNYSGKKVLIRGHVVKVNNSIMKRNWVHLQDGTKDGGNFDLTVTTMATVNVDDVVTFEGTVSVNKDFGAGYSYELILEEALLK